MSCPDDEEYTLDEAIKEYEQALCEYKKLDASDRNRLDFITYFDNNRCLALLSLFAQQQSREFAKKHNSKWINMTMIDWIGEEDHPCPIITINSKPNNCRIKNYVKIENMDKYEEYKFNINLKTKAKCLQSSTGKMKFLKNIDQFILDKTDKINSSKSWFDTTFYDLILAQPPNNTIKCYILIFRLNNQYPIYIYLQRMPSYHVDVTRETRKSIISGYKIKLQIIESQKKWNKHLMSDKLWFYQLSYHLGQLFIKNDITLGFAHYCYKYKPKYFIENCIKYYYLEYNPCKPLQSIKQYYKNLSPNQIIKRQKYASPPYIQQLNGRYISSLYDKHNFYVGIISKKKVINTVWKNKIFTEIQKWIKMGPNQPSGVHKIWTATANRWKFFIYYWYVYRQKNQSTKQIQLEEKTGGGLREIKSKSIPQWIPDLVKYLKTETKFIEPDLEINQIGINYYFNPKGKDMVYSSIDSHTEHGKFKFVYSISLYSDTNGETFLSFNLKNNTYNGDFKIPLPDCGGIKMINPSFSMNGASHSVAQYELPLYANQWRIVILLRGILDKHKIYFANKHEKSKVAGKKRKYSDI